MKAIFLKYYFLLFSLLFFLNSNIECFAQKKTVHKSQKIDSVQRVRFNKAKEKKKPLIYSGHDGPYIINDTLFSVNAKNRLVILPKFDKDSLLVRTDNKDKDEFYFSLKEKHTIPRTIYDLPNKMTVISDIEGNYDAFAGFLYSNKIIDKNHNWIYNDGHLVLIGDFVDRGKNVTQVLWLIYKLEQQAMKQSGVVHFILGNHEIMNFNGDYRYNQEKYIKAAKEISQINKPKEATKYMYSVNSELGKWLATKNVIEKIGSYIFVHAGLSPKILEYKLGLNEINNLARKNFQNKKRSENKTVKFLFSSKGPLWYRGLFFKTKNYPKITLSGLDSVLNYYDAEKIVIGHTHVKNVSTDFNGKVIRTDVVHADKKFSGKTQGLLIENHEEFIIDANFTKTPLKN
ncbi:metallophosphoesterase [Polaribacter pectinis]|uniref:Metallophosphoesterase n=1 Tax=Polaribacter pectinis TaxID=2738844 RepID=A0A7G9L916_9FLAO|nr:metallophosphoesterase [Polaribacter pectinis]QNM85115.1 metallophosphoesterase [Polaribacter pectinis]